jgi:serine phosphatase RsbU (regulator of sigma subunit)/integral membrane sensor domain MASE1/anti-sigma regulatory factor (Ser/Thr protein kinase)
MMDQPDTELSPTEELSGAAWTWPSRSPRWGKLQLFAAVVLAYGIGSQLALFLIEVSELQGVLFIGSGVTVAFLLRLPRRFWWVVLVAAGITEFLMDVGGGFSVSESAGFAIANVAEPLVGASIVAANCRDLDLTRRRHLIWFTLGAVLVGPGVGAALGAGADLLFAGDAFLATFGQWWLGDSLGVILVGGAILAWGSGPDRRPLLSLSGINLVLGSMVLTAGIFAFTDLPLMFTVLIGVILGGVLFGVRAVTVIALSVVVTIALMLIVDPGPFIVGMDTTSAIILIKLQVALFTLAGLLVAAESHERELAMGLAARSSLEVEVHKRERIRERELAKRLQRGLLPDRLVSRQGLEIAARYEAAGELFDVGGDWYDTIELDDSRIALVVGDIVGHGIEAMTSMGRLRTALAALALHNDDPATLLKELDEFVGGPDGTKYATVFYAIVDFENRSATYASAGHPPGLLLSPSGDTQWLDQGQNEPLTGTAMANRKASVEFEPGSTLVLYSDGLIERRDESLAAGMDRLESLSSQMTDRPAAAMCDHLFTRLRSGADRLDDTVVLVARFVDESEYYGVFPAIPEELANMRASVSSWAAANEIPDSVTDDLLLAVGEAASNTVKHAYRDSSRGAVTIQIGLVDGYLAVKVDDTGRWREPRPVADSPGLGTSILRAITEHLDINESPGGTQVTFRVPVSTAHRRAEPV